MVKGWIFGIHTAVNEDLSTRLESAPVSNTSFNEDLYWILVHHLLRTS